MADLASQTSHPPSTASLSSIKLWTPVKVSVVTFFLGFAGGITLASMNWRRMRLKNKALKYLLMAAAGVFVLFVLGLFVAPEIAGLSGLLVNIAVMLHLRKQMEYDMASFKSTGVVVENASWLSGFITGLVGLALSLALMFVIAIVLVIFGILPPR